MKGRKKSSKWVTAIAVIASVAAIYYAFNIGRGIYYNNRGTAYMAEGEYEKAISCFGKALKVRRKFPEAYCNRGTAYSENGEYDRAVPDFNKAIELNPEFADAYYNRAVVYCHKKQYDKAWDIKSPRILSRFFVRYQEEKNDSNADAGERNRN